MEAIVRAAGTSFYRGMAVLPPDRRHAMYAIYAFCRIVDDIADEEAAFADKLPRLAAWRERIDALYRGETEDAVTRVLLLAIRQFDLRRQDFLDMIDGMQMDAEEVIVAPELAKLDLYCDRVAASVGRLSVRAFGDASVHADKVAHALGRALQLTNILRDVAEDAERDRLYLPAEYLAAEGVPADPSGGAAPSRATGGVPARRCIGGGLFPRRPRGDGAVRSARDEAGAADGRDLCRHSRPAGGFRLGRSHAARQPAEMAEDLARAALWSAMRRNP